MPGSTHGCRAGSCTRGSSQAHPKPGDTNMGCGNRAKSGVSPPQPHKADIGMGGKGLLGHPRSLVAKWPQLRDNPPPQGVPGEHQTPLNDSEGGRPYRAAPHTLQLLLIPSRPF